MGAFGDYLAQLRECIRAGLWYPALALALALPDICAALEGLRGNHEQRAAEWLNQNRIYLALDPKLLYLIRCAFLHSGTGILGDRRTPRGRVVLLAPSLDGMHVTSMRSDGTQLGEYRIEVDEVTRCLYDAAGRWAEAHQELLSESEASGNLLAILANPRNKPIAE